LRPSVSGTHLEPTSNPAPSLYAAVPYSAIVVVPEPMDQKLAVSPGGGHLDRSAIVEPPPIKLVPLRR
jgi:hypothetical protein